MSLYKVTDIKPTKHENTQIYCFRRIICQQILSNYIQLIIT